MDVRVLFNSDGTRDDFSVGWGVSFLVNHRILFDTGEKAEALVHNITGMAVDFSSLDGVVISHDHWDHTGGLRAALETRPGINVYSCPGFSEEFKKGVKAQGGRLIENSGFAEIAKNIFVTGEILGDYKGQPMPEQALVARTDKGLTVITGCAHPGIVRMLEQVRAQFPEDRFYAVFGGFHLMKTSSEELRAIVRVFKSLGVRKAGPTHCSGAQAQRAFQKEYGDDLLSVRAGEILAI